MVLGTAVHLPGCVRMAFRGGGVTSATPLCSAAEVPEEVRFFPDAAPEFLRLFLVWDAFFNSSTVGRPRTGRESQSVCHSPSLIPWVFIIPFSNLP